MTTHMKLSCTDPLRHPGRPRGSKRLRDEREVRYRDPPVQVTIQAPHPATSRDSPRPGLVARAAHRRAGLDCHRGNAGRADHAGGQTVRRSCSRIPTAASTCATFPITKAGHPTRTATAPTRLSSNSRRSASTPSTWRTRRPEISRSASAGGRCVRAGSPARQALPAQHGGRSSRCRGRRPAARCRTDMATDRTTTCPGS